MDFSERVNRFYRDFSDCEKELRGLLDQGKAEEAAGILQPMLQSVFGEILFQVYKDAKGRYVIECNTMLDATAKILCFYFSDSIPERMKKHWDVYYFHPAHCGSLQFAGREFKASDFSVIPVVQSKLHKIDIQIMENRAFAGMGDEDRYVACYMMLIDYLGEMTVEAYLGSISFRKKPGLFGKKESGAMALSELNTFFRHTIQSKGWINIKEIRLIADSFHTAAREKECRRDMSDGVSYSLDLMNEEAAGMFDRHFQYLKDCGVRYGSLVLEHGEKKEKENKRDREEWEKRISGLLAEDRSGMIVMSCSGAAHEYIDFFAYSETAYERVREMVQKEGEDRVKALDLLDQVTG